MNTTEILRIGVDLIQVLLVPLLGFAMRTLSELHKEIRAINGRLISLEQWRSDHITESDRRFRDWMRIMRKCGLSEIDD